MTNGVFPIGGVAASKTIGAGTGFTLTAGGTALFYRNLCDPRLDPAAMNALISELVAAVNAAGASYDVTKTNNLALALQNIQAGSTSNSEAAGDALAATIAALKGTAPTGLDTLGEIAAALCNDPHFCQTVNDRFTALIGSPPANLNTIAELAAAIGSPNAIADLQSALAAKADETVTILGGGIATGGGDLSADRTITVQAATVTEISDGTATNRAITPKGLIDYLTALETARGGLVFATI